MKLTLAFLLLILCAGSAWAENGYATYYTVKSCQQEGTSGVYTANGEKYDEGAMTCALRNRHFGRFYAVYGVASHNTMFVRHNDYGPGKGPRKAGVVIDLTPLAFKEVCGDLKQGRCEVSIQEIIE